MYTGMEVVWLRRNRWPSYAAEKNCRYNRDHETRPSKSLAVLEPQLSVCDVRRQAAMNSPRPMPARQFLFLKAEKPDAAFATPPRDSKSDGRHQHSHKKRQLFAIKRDLQAAAAAVRDTSVESMQLVDRLEVCRPPRSSSMPNEGSSGTAAQSKCFTHRAICGGSIASRKQWRHVVGRVELRRRAFCGGGTRAAPSHIAFL